MSTETYPDSQAPVICIAGELTIFRAAEIKRLLASHASLEELDLSGVTEFDSAGLQLILAAWQQALARQRPLRLVALSPAVQEVLELLNLSAHFKQPQVTGTQP